MQYMLLIYLDESAMKNMSAEDMAKMSPAYEAYTKALVTAGVLVGGDRLERSGLGATVRIANGKTQVLNGPYAETREQLGGYYIIEAADIDAAVAWAARCPGAATGAIEVRPVVRM